MRGSGLASDVSNTDRCRVAEPESVDLVDEGCHGAAKSCRLLRRAAADRPAGTSKGHHLIGLEMVCEASSQWVDLVDYGDEK